MNLAYLIYSHQDLSSPLNWLINICIYLVVALIVWAIVKTAASEFNVSAGIVKLIGLVLFLIFLLVIFTGCSTTTGDPAKDRRNAIANALLLDSAKVLGKAAFNILQTTASQELSGQDADWGHAAAKTLWSSSLSLSDFGDVSDAINGATQNRIPDVAAHAAEAFAMAAPQTPAEKVATVNAIAGTISGVAMKAMP